MRQTWISASVTMGSLTATIAMLTLPIAIALGISGEVILILFMVVWAMTLAFILKEVFGRRFVRRLTKLIPSMMQEGRMMVTWNKTGSDKSLRKVPPECALGDNREWRRTRGATFNGTRPFITTIEHKSVIIRIKHGKSGQAVTVEVPGPHGEAISETVSVWEADLLAHVLRRQVIARYAEHLGVKARLGDVVRRIVDITSVKQGRQWAAVEGSDIRLLTTKVNKSGKWTRNEAWLVSPSMGVLHVPGDMMESAKASQRQSHIDSALGERLLPAPSMPVLIGSPKMSKTVAMAYRLVERYPDLSDSYGTRIAPLIHEHLPRLIERHENAMRAATAGMSIEEDTLRQIDDEFNEGLGHIEKALVEGLEMEQRRSRDDLNVEIAFLKSRHPVNIADTLTS